MVAQVAQLPRTDESGRRVLSNAVEEFLSEFKTIDGLEIDLQRGLLLCVRIGDSSFISGTDVTAQVAASPQVALLYSAVQNWKELFNSNDAVYAALNLSSVGHLSIVFYDFSGQPLQVYHIHL